MSQDLQVAPSLLLIRRRWVTSPHADSVLTRTPVTHIQRLETLFTHKCKHKALSLIHLRFTLTKPIAIPSLTLFPVSFVFLDYSVGLLAAWCLLPDSDICIHPCCACMLLIDLCLSLILILPIALHTSALWFQ